MKALLLAAMLCGSDAMAQQARTNSDQAKGPVATYSQKTLLKNWTMSVCLAKVAKTQDAKEDANAAASAYMEFGKLPIEAYEPLRELADRFAKRTYGGSIQSDFNTMKCIDLMHSSELDTLATRLAKSAK